MKYTKLLCSALDWRTLERAIASLSGEHERGDAFEEFCGAYLRLIPEYNIKNVWKRGQFPGWVVRKLRLSGQKDQGIDLIGLTNDNKLWAIQAKVRSTRDDVLYRELSTFLAISDGADFRLIISNTKKLAEVVLKRQHCGAALVDRLDALDKSFFSSLREFLRKRRRSKPKPFTHKPHQAKAIRAAERYFRTNDRGQLVMACGTAWLQRLLS